MPTYSAAARSFRHPQAGARKRGRPELAPPRWHHITGAYAAALGLTEVPLRLARSGGMVVRGPSGGLLEARAPIPVGIEHQGWGYVRDGSGYTLAGLHRLVARV